MIDFGSHQTERESEIHRLQLNGMNFTDSSNLSMRRFGKSKTISFDRSTLDGRNVLVGNIRTRSNSIHVTAFGGFTMAALLNWVFWFSKSTGDAENENRRKQYEKLKKVFAEWRIPYSHSPHFQLSKNLLLQR